MDPMLRNSVRKQKELQAKQRKNAPFQKPLTPQQIQKIKYQSCQKWDFQSYNQFNKLQPTYLLNECLVNDTIQRQNCSYEKAYNRAQNLLNQYRMNPQKFPLTSWTYQNGLTKAQQRQYSDTWYKRTGAACAMGSVQPGYPYSTPMNWPGMAITGSQTTYTDGFLQNVPYETR